MKQRRRFSIELKRQVVEELLSGTSTPAQLMRRYELSSGLLYHWKEQYAKGRFDNERALHNSDPPLPGPFIDDLPDEIPDKESKPRFSGE